VRRPIRQQASAQERICLQAYRRIGRDSHLLHCFQELLALADEESIRSETFDRRHRAPKFVGQGANDRDRGKVALEFSRDREDQAGLNRWIEWTEKIRERQAGYGIRKWRGEASFSSLCSNSFLNDLFEQYCALDRGDHRRKNSRMSFDCQRF
jgi:hypothetical protein